MCIYIFDKIHRDRIDSHFPSSFPGKKKKDKKKEESWMNRNYERWRRENFDLKRDKHVAILKKEWRSERERNTREDGKVSRGGCNRWRKRWMIGNNGSQSGGRIHASESVRLSDTRRSTTQRFEQSGVASKPLLDLRRGGGWGGRRDGRVFRRVVRPRHGWNWNRCNDVTVIGSD